MSCLSSRSARPTCETHQSGPVKARRDAPLHPKVVSEYIYSSGQVDNTKRCPTDINAQAKETLRGPGFFDMPFIFDGPGCAPLPPTPLSPLSCAVWAEPAPQRFDADELSHSTLLGAEINQRNFNSSGAWKAFGPWEQSRGASFFPGV